MLPLLPLLRILHSLLILPLLPLLPLLLMLIHTTNLFDVWLHFEIMHVSYIVKPIKSEKEFNCKRKMILKKDDRTLCYPWVTARGNILIRQLKLKRR